MNMPPCMMRFEGNNGRVVTDAGDLVRISLPRSLLAGALGTTLPAVLAFGFPEKTRSQPDANFFDVPV